MPQASTTQGRQHAHEPRRKQSESQSPDPRHPILESIESGETLTVALAESGLFPDEFIEMVDVGETSGTVPEALHRLSPQFEEQARRSLKTLTAALGMLVWLTVAGFIVFFIFRFVLWYVGMITDAVQGT